MGRTDRSATETRGPGKIPSKTTPATAHTRTTEIFVERVPDENVAPVPVTAHDCRKDQTKNGQPGLTLIDRRHDNLGSAGRGRCPH